MALKPIWCHVTPSMSDCRGRPARHQAESGFHPHLRVEDGFLDAVPQAPFVALTPETGAREIAAPIYSPSSLHSQGGEVGVCVCLGGGGLEPDWKGMLPAAGEKKEGEEP